MNLSIPTSWADITTAQYNELRQFEIDTNIIYKILQRDLNVHDEDFKTLVTILSILLDISEDTIYKIEVESFDLILSKLNWIKPIQSNHKSKIEFNKMNVGMFVDLESIIEEGLEDNYIKFINRMFEKQMDDQPITDVYSEAYNYLIWRKKLYEDFSGLFEQGEETTNDEIKNSSEIAVSLFNKKWNWYGFLFSLASGDILKMDAVTDLNVIHAFNHLSYMHEKKNLKG